MWTQLYSCHDPTALLSSQALHTSPPSAKWPFSRYDTVIISSDGNKDWPCNGLQGGSMLLTFSVILLNPCYYKVTISFRSA